MFKGNDLGEIFEEMFPHMRTQVEILALADSEVVFDQVLFLDVNFHQLNLPLLFQTGFRARRW